MLFSFSYMSSGGCITVCAKETRLLANFFGHVCRACFTTCVQSVRVCPFIVII
jgi:hypothetical protein